MKDLWISFVNSVRTLMVASPHDSGLNQYLSLRDYVTELMKDEKFESLLVATFDGYPKVKEGATETTDELKTKIVEALKWS